MSSPPVAKKESGAKLIKIKTSQGDASPGSPPKLVITEPDHKEVKREPKDKVKASGKSKRLTLDLTKANSEPIFDKARIKERVDQIHNENNDKKSNNNKGDDDSESDTEKELRRSKSISNFNLFPQQIADANKKHNDGSRTARGGREDEETDGNIHSSI
jgi:hypothetical protein